MEPQEIKRRIDWLEEQRREDQRRVAALSERVTSELQRVDTTQINKRLDWLENERRQDKKTITTLTERLNETLGTNAAQARRITDLESELSKLGAYLSKITDLDANFDNIRTEFSRQIDAAEQRRLEADRETERLRVLEREGLNRAMTELKKSTEPITRLEQELLARREEEKRLGRTINEIKQAIDNAVHGYEDLPGAISKIEENLRQEVRRSNTLQTEATELRRRIEEYIGKLEVIEDIARRNDSKVNEIVRLETDRRISQQSWMESQAIMQAERERLLNDIQKRAEELENLPTNITRQIEKYSELHRDMEKTVTSFDTVLTRLERRINEAAEIQRLQEEQFRQEWAAFQADDQKKWTTHMLLRDEQWRDHDREYHKTAERLSVLTDELAEINAEVTRIQQTNQLQLQSLFNFARELLADYDTQLQKVR